jgi:predicted DsbA family dithiol-disulfide isomerase
VSVRRIQQEYDAVIRWRAYPLHPDIPPAGMDYRSYFGGEAAWASVAERLGAMAAMLSLPFNMPKVKYDSRRAEELTAWAVTEVPDAVDSLRTAIFQAIWADGVNNSDPAVLTDIAASVDISRDLAMDALEDRRGRATVDTDWQDAMARRIRGVPVVLIGDQEVTGAQLWPVFAEALESAGIRSRDT